MDRITYVGHSTVLIELAGVKVITDPLLRRWAGPLYRHAPPVDGDALRSPDAVLLSHLHIDHVDRGSLRRLDPGATVLVPAAGERIVESVGFTDIRIVSPGDHLVLGGIRIDVVPARHDGQRFPMARDGEAVGYVLTAPRSVYFPGDTACFPEMADLVATLDVALLPVWGWGVSVDEDEHLTPLGAAKCLSLLRPRLAIPIHWGTYAPPALARLRRFDQLEPPHAFARYAAHLEPEVEIRILRPGESTAPWRH
jgi:L-ascorbate metabolism protein UlaG (beta-lactamase superfamily)